MNSILDIKFRIQTLFSNKLDIVFTFLDCIINKSGDKYNTYVLIRGRFSDFREIRNFGFLSADDLVSQQQQIRYAIQQFLSELTTDSFIPEFLQNPDFFLKAINSDSEQKQKPEHDIPFVHKTGELLYHIPKRMQFKHTYRCVIRVAYIRELLFQNWQEDEYDIEKTIRIGEEMNVEIINVYEPEPFKIKSLNRSSRQILDKEDYTEWLFDVTPEYEGTYSLLLRITAIEIKEGREVNKEIVVEEFVIVDTKQTPKSKIKLQKMEGKIEFSTTKTKLSDAQKNTSSKSSNTSSKKRVGGLLGLILSILSLFLMSKGTDNDSDDSDDD